MTEEEEMDKIMVEDWTEEEVRVVVEAEVRTVNEVEVRAEDTVEVRVAVDLETEDADGV